MKLSITMISYEDYARKGEMSVAQFIDRCAGLGVDAVDILEYFWRDNGCFNICHCNLQLTT